MDKREQAYQDAIAVCDEAKRLSLSEYFARESHTDLKFENGRHRCEWCPHCGLSKSGNKRVFITDDAVWECWLCERRGSILDVEMFLYGGTLSEAARRLLGVAHDDAARGRPVRLREHIVPEVKLAQMAAEKRKHDAAAQVIEMICEHTKTIRDDQVMQYLTGTGRGQRGFPIEVIEDAVARNILRILPSNYALANAMIRSIVPEQLLRDAGMWKDESKTAWVTFRPIWFIAPGAISAELRIARPARDGEAKSIKVGPKHRPYYWEGKNPKGCALVEGGPDLLALAALGYEGDILAMPGVNTWDIDWFVKMAQARGTIQFETFFDNDELSERNVGQIAAADLGAELVARNLRWKNHVLPAGDVNDLWLQRVRNR
jgi:hypothetical protein